MEAAVEEAKGNQQKVKGKHSKTLEEKKINICIILSVNTAEKEKAPFFLMLTTDH
jgi:hypothetical protein